MILNAASPEKCSLDTVNGITQSVAAAATIVGRIIMGWTYGVGLRQGVVGVAWWVMSGFAIVIAIASLLYRLSRRKSSTRQWAGCEQDDMRLIILGANLSLEYEATCTAIAFLFES